MTKKPIVYAFIDSQNLNLGVQSQGWKLDFKKFRLYLKNKYGVEKAYLFIGLVAGNEQLYTNLSSVGYELIFKPTVTYDIGGKTAHKGNVDAELVLYAAAKTYREYDKAIIVSGDGDFRCLVEYLTKKQKLLHIMTPNHNFSKLLRDYLKYIVQISKLRGSLEYKKRRLIRSVETLGRAGKPSRSSGRYETLGLPKHGDKLSITNKSSRVNPKKKNLYPQKPTKKTSISLPDARGKVTRHGNKSNVVKTPQNVRRDNQNNKKRRRQ